MVIGVERFAMEVGVSARRVRALIQAGDIRATRVGRSWAIDEVELGWRPRAVRPMSRRMAWAFISELSGQRSGVAATEARRLAVRLDALHVAVDPADLLRAWLPERALRREFTAAPADLADLRADRRLVISGWSDPRSELSSASAVEGYVAAEAVGGLVDDFLLRPAVGGANIVLHVTASDEADPLLGPDTSFGRLVADLSEHSGAREYARVRELLLEGAPTR